MSENFDLILSGLQSNDFGYAQLGMLISELLNFSNGSLVMGTELIDNNIIKIKRELENGWFQWAELNLPASLSIQSGINQPRYATLKGIMSVKNKSIEKCNYKEFSLSLDKGYRVKELYIPKKSKKTCFIEGNIDEMVEEITDVLKNKIKVI